MTAPHTDAVRARPPLRRPRSDRLLLGVCAAVARSLDLPALAVRLGAVALAAVAFPLVLVGYVILAAIVPRDDGRVLLGGAPPDRREALLGWSLVALVLYWLAAAEFRLEGLVWPALSSFGVFAAAVAALVLLALNQRRAAPQSTAPDAPMASAAAAPDATPREGTAAAFADAPGAGDTATTDAPGTGDTAATAAFADAPTRTQPLPPPPPRGLSLGTIGAAMLLIAGALAFLLDATGAIDPGATEVAIGLAVAAALAGGGAIAGAVQQRRGTIALLALGTVLAAAAAGVGLVAEELDDGVGWRTERPATAADIPDRYVLGVGELDVDLRDTALPAGATTVRARVRAGELTVLVPRGVRVASIGPTQLDGIARVNALLPQPKPAKTKRQRRERRRAAAEQRTVRIDADVREGDANVVAVGP